MPCNAPLPAWQVPGGKKPIFGLKKPSTANAEAIMIPCTKCVGCRTSKAQEWALRCTLELHDHEHAAFVTLTYCDKYCPPTLTKRDLVLWFKRFRKALGANRPIRYFASGEYGELTQRPHYHALVFGASEADRALIDRAWTTRTKKGRGSRKAPRASIGRTSVSRVTPAHVSYVAGYTQKKLNDELHTRHLRVDPDTGEAYYWVPPFIEMSRGGHGIGGKARQHVQSWQDYAVLNGNKIAVPRYYHAAWKAQATPEQIEKNKAIKKERAQAQNITLEQLEARETITVARQKLRAAKRIKV